MMIFREKSLTNSVLKIVIVKRMQVLSNIIRHKAFVGGFLSPLPNLKALHWTGPQLKKQ